MVKQKRHFVIFLVLFISCINSQLFAEELNIPVLVGQTGASAIFGRNETDAYTLAVEEWNSRGGVNGKHISLDIEDTQTQSKQIVTAFQRFAIHKPPVVLGPTWLDGFPVIISSAQKNDTLLVTPSAAIEAFSETDRQWPVSFYHNTTTEIKVLLNYLKEKGHKRIALIYEQEPYAEMIRKLLLSQTTEVVSDFGVQTGEVDFQSYLLRLKSQNPDVIIVFTWNERSLLTLLQKLQSYLPNIPIATVHDGAGWLKNNSFQAVLPHLIYPQFLFSDSSFESRFKARFGYDPILTASNAYDAINAVLSAISAGANTGKQIQDYLLSNEHQTVTFGKFKFSSDRSVPSNVKVIEYEK